MIADISTVVKFLKARISVFIAFAILHGFTGAAHAQGDGARFYWKTLMGTNAIPLIGSSIGGNSNPLDPAHFVVPGSDFEATMSTIGYAKMLPLKKRAAMIALLLPMGRISSDVSLNGLNYNNTARGYGDPMLQVDVNIIGPKAIMGIPDAIRYEPRLSVDVMGSIAFPLGNYDNESPINMGQNRWYGRFGLPVVWQIGSWVPGKRTTFECLPAIWLFGDNTDFVGMKMHTDPMFQAEAHLTRDFMEHVWGSIDVVSISGGKATLDTLEGKNLSNIGVGGTIGYQINENLSMNISYSSTAGDTNPEDLKMDGFRITLIYGWHPLIEGMQRMKSEK